MNYAGLDALVGSALIPVLLIAAVSIILHALILRYSHAADRVRSMMRDRNGSGEAARIALERSIEVLLLRCRTLRSAIMMIALSLVACGAMLLISALEGLLDTPMLHVKLVLLGLAVILVIGAAVLIIVEARYSLRALELEAAD